ncbi:MAG: hypothetical protein HY908_09030 [Myxococcales bacterium]|nr:hypothetical protein [Myxococcales bacterium]
MDFEAHHFVMLRRGATGTPAGTPEAEALRKRHLAHLFALLDSGKMVACGPCEDQDDADLRGMCIYRTGTAAEARALAESDPAVQAGELRVELLTWKTPRGQLAFPKAPA